MKKILLGLLLCLLLIGITGCKNNNNNLEGGADTLVSFKNTDLNITNNDLYNILKDKYGTSLLIELIDTKILDKEYPDDEATSAYVDVQTEAIKSYYSTESEFLEYINNYGYQNEDELKNYFKLSYKRNLAVYDYLKGIITEDEINSYYDKNIIGDITASHILIEVETTDTMTDEEKRTAKEEALAKANEVITKLDEGSTFSDLAKEYSNDSATKYDSGKMGTFNGLDVDIVTLQELKNLKVNAYSTTPIETEYGYEIFLKTDEKNKPKLEEVKTKIIKTLSDQKLEDDSKLQYKAQTAIREKYGFSIKDSDLEVYYENYINNLMASE